MNRLIIIPVPRLWRSEHEIQFGLDPAGAVVVHIADPAHARLFDLLDGSRSERAVLRDAAALGIESQQAYQLLAALRDAGLIASAHSVLPDSLIAPVRARLATEAAAIALARRRGPSESGRPSPAEALRRRSAAAVLVTGAARLVVPIAVALATAGVGHIEPQVKGRVTASDVVAGGLSPADTGKPRTTAAAAAILRAAPHTNTRKLRDGTVSFVVQAGIHAPSEVLAHGLARRRLPHLLIEERDDAIVVGPLVVPGHTSCLHCLDRHRRDRDPAWPALAAQIATAPEAPAGSAVSTVLIATGIAAAQVLGHIDGDDVETLDASIEIAPAVQIRRRSWGPHPACTCIRRPVSRLDPSLRVRRAVSG